MMDRVQQLNIFNEQNICHFETIPPPNRIRNELIHSKKSENIATKPHSAPSLRLNQT